MKWFIISFVLFISALNVSVLAVRPPSKPKEIISIDVEPINYGQDKNFLDEGAVKKIVCKGSHKFQKLEWHSPSGELVKREPTNRVYVQDHFIPSIKSRSPSLVLVFTHAMVSDSGKWKCKAADLEQEVPLCVLEPAKFVDTPEEVSIDEGRSITLTCQARGNPEPKIQWYRNGELLAEDESDKIYTSTKYNHHGFEGLLTIKSLTPDDAGTYVCEAVQEHFDVDNCGFTNSVNITLNINSRPKFHQEYDVVYMFAKDNETSRLLCNPTAYPTPKFRWFHVEEGLLSELSHDLIQVSDDGTQSILSLTANDTTFGQKYRCLVENRYGDASITFQILRMEKPPKPSEVVMTNATNRMIEFNITWDQSDSLVPVDAIDIQYFEKRTSGTPRQSHWRKAKSLVYGTPSSIDTSDMILPLLNLKENTEYWVRVRAVNEVGQSDWSTPALGGTLVANEEIEEELPFELQQETGGVDFGVFLGFILVVSIVLFAALCIFIVKRS